MRSRLMISLALLAGVLLGSLSTVTPARALSCAPCPAVTTDALNLRAAPNQNAAILVVIPSGAEVEYDNMMPAQNGYLAVSYNGFDGYAHRLYLLLFPTTATPTDWLNLRSGPSATSPIIQVMPPGSEVQVRSKAENGYYSVSFEQRVPGYAHGDFLSFDNTGSFADGETVVVRTDALNVRVRGGLDYAIQGTIYSGRQVTITGGPVERDGYSWYRIDGPNLDSGWVAGEFLARS